jgi:predicted nucleic acid-binding protein
MGLSCLSDQTAPIIGDASTVINLNATGCAPAILRAVPNHFFIMDVVLDELREDVRSGRNDALLVSQLVGEGLVTVADLGSLKNDDFERLVSGSTAATLDDGEAATIAYASGHGMTALIDERKANRICRTQYPHLLVGATVDLLALERVEAALGMTALANAAYEALQGARMRVLPKHLDWVVKLIGQDRAALCESLPRYVRSALQMEISAVGKS